MQSPTAEVKEIIVNLLKAKPGMKFSTTEIKEEIYRKATQTITEGVIAGAISTLSKDKRSGIINPIRTIYAYNPQAAEEELDLTHKLYNGVNDSIDTLQNVIKSIDVLELDEKDFPTLRKLKALIGNLESFNEELLETYGKEING